MRNDPIQGILFAEPSLIKLGQLPKKNIVERMLLAAKLAGGYKRPGKPITHVNVQCIGGDQYITDPAMLLERFRQPDGPYQV